MEHKYIEIKGLSKIFTRKKESVHALENIDCSVDRGELVCILGPSGCGKSTLLRAICGLDTEHSGDVFIDGRKVIKPEKTRGMVFQEHRLFPWLTVEENVAFALNGVDKDTKAELVQQHIDLVGLTGFEKSYPRQLSGGMAIDSFGLLRTNKIKANSWRWAGMAIIAVGVTIVAVTKM